MMAMNHNRKSRSNPEMNKCHNHKLKPTKRDPFQGWQKQRSALFTNQPRENVSPFVVGRVIAAAMAIRFIVITLIWFAIFITLLCNNEVSISSVPSREDFFAQCPKNWIYYRNNCYQFFNETKNWNQSQASCLSQNSSLLKIYSQEDQDFLKLVKSYHWMGLVHIQPNDSWMWEDGSTLSPTQLTLVEMQSGSCAVYGSSFKAYTEDCSAPNTYICMKRAV